MSVGLLILGLLVVLSRVMVPFLVRFRFLEVLLGVWSPLFLGVAMGPLFMCLLGVSLKLVVFFRMSLIVSVLRLLLFVSWFLFVVVLVGLVFIPLFLVMFGLFVTAILGVMEVLFMVLVTVFLRIGVLVAVSVDFVVYFSLKLAEFLCLLGFGQGSKIPLGVDHVRLLFKTELDDHHGNLMSSVLENLDLVIAVKFGESPSQVIDYFHQDRGGVAQGLQLHLFFWKLHYLVANFEGDGVQVFIILHFEDWHIGILFFLLIHIY